MKSMLITGAAGFIGRAACQWFRNKYQVIAIDDLSRETSKAPEGVMFIKGDCVKDLPVIHGVDIILHLAAQVSVTKSLHSPIEDYQNNAAKTFFLALRASKMSPPPIFIYASTNKVFGDLKHYISNGRRDPVMDTHPVDPMTPYGISKACGGMYVREFLPSTGFDFRQSCIYGEDQQGTIDQGWIGYLRRQIAKRSWITCFGDGTQVRDLLHVSDLLRVYELAINGSIPPGSYTVGGGLENAVSFDEAVLLLGGRTNAYGEWRDHDQRWFVSQNTGLWLAGWKPEFNAKKWLEENRPPKGGPPPKFLWQGFKMEQR